MNRTIADEHVFNQLISHERKRTERTGDPFVLMIMDIRALQGPAATRTILRICEAIRVESRDTDLCGWYRFPSSIGKIFTTLRGANRLAVLSALERKADAALRKVLLPADLKKVSVSFHFFPEESDGETRNFKSDEIFYPELQNPDPPRMRYEILKRGLDICGSLAGLILFSPFFLIIPIAIKLTSRGPVFFAQQRIGKFAREFVFLKFRTMYAGNSPEVHEQFIRSLIEQPEPDGNGSKGVFKIVDDPRVTPVGRFLRKTSLDELPQFINVLKGDMSLVGPRPPISYEVACYRSWHRRRVIEVKPGITGLWQVCGRSSTRFDEMVRLDLRYVREQSIRLDLKILLRTPAAVLSLRGAY